MNKIFPLLLLIILFGCKTSKPIPITQVSPQIDITRPINNMEEYMEQINVYLKIKEYDKVIANCKEVIKQDSTLWQPHAIIGIAYRNINKFPEAIYHFKKVIKLHPQDEASSYNNLANIYTELGYNDFNLNLYNKALRISPSYANAYNNRGNLYLDLLEYDKAIADFKKSISIKPTGRDPYNNLGIAYMELEKYKLAEENLYKAIEIDPDFRNPLLALGELFKKQNKEKEANEIYKKLIPLLTQDIEDNRYDYSSLLYRAEIYTQLGEDELARLDYQKANEMYDEIVIQNPYSWTMLNKRGSTYVGLKQYDNARADFNSALILYPKSRESKVKLAEIENK